MVAINIRLAGPSTDTVYWADFQFDVATKDFVKSLGFRFDPVRKGWWTKDATVAARVGMGSAQAIADVNREREEKARAAAMALDASRATDAAGAFPVPEGLAYLGYQRAGIAYAMDRPGVLIADEMGLGKTIQAIGIANADEAAKRVLIICPASLKLNWQREWIKWTVHKALSVGVVTGTKGPLPVADVLIINYDLVRAHRAALDTIAWDLLIVDEAHALKNPKAQRTQAVLGKGGKGGIAARRRVLLTGTPIVNRPVELWPLVQTLDPEGLGRAFMGYARRYCNAHQTRFGWDFSGACHLDELQQRLRSSVMVRRLKADVLTELPPKRRSVVVIAPDATQAKAVKAEAAAYNRHAAELEALQAAAELAKAGEDEAAYRAAVDALREGHQAAFTEMAKERAAVAVAKVPAVTEYVLSLLDETDKVVVMGTHHAEIDGLMEAFRAAGCNPVKLDGRDSMADRQGSVDRFQTDPACRVFVGSIRAAGVGITLVAASTVVFSTLDWTPGNVSQAEDRCHRIGQRDTVNVYHVVLDGSLDVRMAQTVVQKQDVIDRALDRDCAEVEAPGLLSVPELPDPKALSATPSEGATRSASRAAIAKDAEALSPAQIAAVHQALGILAGMDTDGARDLNGIGFNKLDTVIGRSLAMADSLTPKQAALGKRIVLKYHRQLGDHLISAVKGE